MFRLLLIYIVLVCSSPTLFAEDSIPAEVQKSINFQAQKFKYLLENAYTNHLDSLNIEKSSETAFKALLKSLDSQSEYYTSTELKEVKERNIGSADGLGLQVVIVSDSVLVASVSKGSTADSAGLTRGDKILFVRDKSLAGMNLNEINKLLSGKKGEAINIIYRKRQGADLAQATLHISDFAISSISSSFYLPNQQIAYIASNRFNALILDEVGAEIQKMLSLGAKALVFDLRGNPGGYLEQVAKLADDFLPEGYKITYTDSRNKSFELVYNTSSNGRFEKLPLIVLIDENSASASEIFAGAMQDLERAVVMGSQSYGKGTVQKTWTLTDGSGYRLTVAEYFTPSGRRIDKAILNRGTSAAELDESLRLSIGDEGFEQLRSSVNSLGGKTRVPIYKTISGKPIIAIGGVLPDLISRADTNTLLTKVLQSKGILFEFAVKYLAETKSEEKLKTAGIQNYLENFIINENIYNDFVKFSFSKNIWNEEMAKTDKETIRMLIKANIAHILWDNFGYYAVKSYDDKLFKLAVTKIPDAFELIK